VTHRDVTADDMMTTRDAIREILESL